MPDNLKLKKGLDRYILRAAMKNLIPNEIYNRTTKSDLSPYYNYSYIKNFDLMKETILNCSDILNDIIDIDKVLKFSINEKRWYQENHFSTYCSTVKWLKCN